MICDEQPLNFYLGVHRHNWIAEAPQGTSLFVSRNVLAPIKNLVPHPLFTHIAIDSGSFTELNRDGDFSTSPEQYVDELIRFDEAFDSIAWAAPQDRMCEPWMFAKTGLTLEQHLQLTVENFVLLEQLWYERGGLGDCPIMPVLQGWHLRDYVRCYALYERAGVRLATDYPVVGVGSVCRRQGTLEAGGIFAELASYDLPLHGFGVKKDGLKRFGRYLTTADSLAWSRAARYNPPGCTPDRKHCGNCLHYALDWRADLLASLDDLDDAPVQTDLLLDL